MMIEKQKRNVGSGVILMVAIIVLALTTVVAGDDICLFELNIDV